jgi:flagellar motor switch protein FliG
MDKIKNAAIIILGLGEKCAADILKNNKIESISEDDLMRALNEFFIDSNTGVEIDVSIKNQVKESIYSKVNSADINSVLDGNDEAKNEWVEQLRQQSVNAILDLIAEEHPQVITMILFIIFNRVGKQKGSDIIKGLPKNIQKDIIKRMSIIGPTSLVSIELLSAFFTKELSSGEPRDTVRIDGLETVANLIALMDAEHETEVLTDLSENEEVKAKLEDKMFPFQKLIELDKKSMQVLLAEVDTKELMLAMKGVDDKIKSYILQNMSSKSAEILKDDMESLGPVKLADVINSQKKIINTAKKLQEEEKIFIANKNDPNIVF